MNTYPRLYELDNSLKSLLIAFLIVLTCGFTVGLVCIGYSSGMTPKSVQAHYNGSPPSDAGTEMVDIPENYAKPLGELLIIIHNHVIGFALIFFLLGGIFYFCSLVNNRLKRWLIVEPFVSILVTFGGMWAMRTVHPGFVYVMAASSAIMYLCFYLMAGMCLWELAWKQTDHGTAQGHRSRFPTSQ